MKATPTCEEETRLRPARKRRAVKKKTTPTCEEETRPEEEDNSDLRGRDSTPTCEEETRLRPARKRLAVKKRRALETRLDLQGRDSP